ncbi:hypothetical protein BU24DRAFT_281240 [Aaosphaeria arxii CBS 175.79]|uniref:Uncharacterized protein n=1 Tax=Aaosphaeria arxii CBS 175.79 TaxID=1450172 RepID=A0A6A5XGE9_9PLEO|nr:uncharacterized protein BU24DRAFT_281240 [Aaosphaeria arxii CBS 175.79]KAF2011444.1 hypothetical protein BU24DRAFT_281240 [Aaosphaeria arxii CBS 175.79]
MEIGRESREKFQKWRNLIRFSHSVASDVNFISHVDILHQHPDRNLFMMGSLYYICLCTVSFFGAVVFMQKIHKSELHCALLLIYHRCLLHLGFVCRAEAFKRHFGSVYFTYALCISYRVKFNPTHCKGE